MSEPDLKLRAGGKGRLVRGNLGRRVAQAHTAQTEGLAVELSNLMWGADPEGRTTFVSEALLQTAGYERDELSGEPLSRLLAAEDGAPAPEQVVGRFLGGERRMPMTLIARDGSRFRIAWEPTARRDRGGRLVEVIGVAREFLPAPKADPLEERQFELLDAARVCVIGMQTDGTIFFFNREAEATLGYGRGDVVGRNYFELFTLHDDAGRPWRDIKQHVAACLEAREYDSTVLAKDGRQVVIRWASTPARRGPALAGGRRADEVFIFGVDVTEARQRAREERVRADIAALSSAPLSLENYFGAVQHHLAQLMGFDAAALVRYDAARETALPLLVNGPIGVAGSEAVPVEGTAIGTAIATRRPCVRCHVGEAELPSDGLVNGAGLESYVAVPLVANGEALGAFAIAATHPEAFGRREVAFLEQIAPNVAAALEGHVLRTELGESRAEYRLLFEQANEGVLVLDNDMRCIEANAAANRLLGAPGRTLVGQPCAELLCPERPDAVRKKLVELERAPACSLGAFALPREDGGAPIEIEAHAARLDERGAFVLIADVTDRNRLRRELHERTREARWLVRSASNGIALVRRGRLVHVNAALVKAFGYQAADQLEGQPVGMLYAAGELERVRQQAGRVASRHEFLGRKRSGATFPVEARGATFGAAERTTLLVLRDLSERAGLARYMRRMQRVSGIAELAGGLSHDFNGLLVTILGGTTLARSLAPGDPRRGSLLGRIRDAASRAAELTSQLLAYSQGGQYVSEAVSLNQVVADALAMLKGCIPRGIRVTTELTPDLPTFDGDPHQFSQVVLQAILNAVEAMPDGGELALSTDVFVAGSGSTSCCLDEAELRRVSGASERGDVRPGSYVRLVVADTGCGMDETTLRRVCEPFFSKKGAGRGLGMAAARGIVTRHDGFLTLSSSPGEGTDIEVLLPTACPPQPGPPGGGGPDSLLRAKEGT